MARPTRMIVLMWVGAFLSTLALWMTRREADEIDPALAAPGTTVHVLEDSAPPPLPPPSDADTRVLYRLGPRHAGVSPFEGPAEGVVRWRLETGGRITAQVVSDRRGGLYVGSHDHFFYAFDRAGRERWKRDLGGRIYSTATVDSAGHIYVGSDAHAVWSFDSDGDQRWRLDVDGDADTGIAGSEDGIVFAAGRAVWSVAFNGTVRWRREVGGKVFTTPIVDGAGNVYVGCQDDLFYSFDAQGEQRWTYRTGNDNDGAPALGADGTLYFGSDDHHVYAIASDGELKWSTDLDGMVRAPIAVAGERLYVGVFGPRPRVVSLDAETGALQWFFPVTVSDTTEIGVASGPAVDAAGNLYFGAHDDYVYSIAPSGALRWAVATGGDVDASPALLRGGLLVVGSDDGAVYAIGAQR